MKSVNNKIREQLWNEKDKIYSRLNDYINYGLSSQIWGQVSNHIINQLHEQVHDQIYFDVLKQNRLI